MEEDVKIAFESINKTLIEQNKVMVTQSTILAEVAVTTKHLASAVDGNGRPGLLDRMRAMEVNHDNNSCRFQDVERELLTKVADITGDQKVITDAIDAKVNGAIVERRRVTDALESKLNDLITAMPGLKTVAKGFWWIAGLFGIAVFGLIWGILTHTIEMMPK